MNNLQQTKLDKILTKVGDLNFKRRILTILQYLDVQPGDVILDAGCGEGFYALILDQLYDCKVIAVDNDDRMLNLAKGWLKNSNKVTFENQLLDKLPYPDNYFNKIICSEVLEHIPDDVSAARELFRVLKPGGVLAVTVPNKNYPFVWDPLNKVRESLGLGHFNPLSGFWGGIWAYDHKRLYTPTDISNVLTTTGFSVEKVDVLTHFGLPFNHLILYTGKQLYTRFPVPAELKDNMEKFKWDSDTKESPTPTGGPTKSFLKNILNSFFSLLKWVDSFNDQEFSLDTSTMAVAVKVSKAVNPK